MSGPITEDPAVIDIFADGHEVEKHLEFWAGQSELDALDAAMFAVWQFGSVHWRWLTEDMTTEEQEASANAVVRHHTAMTGDEAAGLDTLALRWWRV